MWSHDMQIAPMRTSPISAAAIMLAVTVMAFAVLLLATGLTLLGADFASPPASATARYTALFIVGVLASERCFFQSP